MTDEFGKMSKLNQQITLTTQPIGLMHWVQDCVCASIDPNWIIALRHSNSPSNKQMFAKSILNFVNVDDKVAASGNFKDMEKWTEWGILY